MKSRKTFYAGVEKWVTDKDVLHRKNGPALIYPNGTKHWYFFGKLHRDNGPAIESANGVRKWYVNGRLHRTDGHAMEWPDGDKYYCLNGFLYSKEEWFAALTPEQRHEAIWKI